MSLSLRVLIIGYVWPEPRSSAAGTHMLQIIEQCAAQRWSVTFASPATAGPQRADLAALGVAEQGIELNNSSFDTWVRELQPDIVIFDRFMMEEQFGWRVAEQCPQALRVLESVDLHCLREARHLHFKEWLRDADAGNQQIVAPQSPQNLYAQMAALDVTQREIAAIFRCDLTLMISDTEIELLTRYFHVPDYLLHYLPLLVEQPEAEDWPGFGERANFISIGNFLHAPNWDAVLFLRETLWPSIRGRLPQAQLYIYGAYPPHKAIQLNNAAQGFHVVGWVEDAAAVLRTARVCLAPLRFGAGIKGKLIDAMRAGTPSVTTSIGAEAMAAAGSTFPEQIGWGGVAADDLHGFVDAAVQLHENQQLWQRAQRQGLAILQQRFDRKRFNDGLVARLDTVREQLVQRRRNNFIGSMLQHHQHKSTHYMARWIEAKNALAASVDSA